tara:strand:- start:48 stop:377 length:330 start_codon:yes stop_codon:yes gene_type:complete
MDLSNKYFNDIDYSNSFFNNVNYEYSVFENCIFYNTTFVNVNLNHSIFNNCELILNECKDTTIQNITLYNTKINDTFDDIVKKETIRKNNLLKKKLELIEEEKSCFFCK